MGGQYEQLLELLVKLSAELQPVVVRYGRGTFEKDAIEVRRHTTIISSSPQAAMCTRRYVMSDSPLGESQKPTRRLISRMWRQVVVFWIMRRAERCALVQATDCVKGFLHRHLMGRSAKVSQLSMKSTSGPWPTCRPADLPAMPTALPVQALKSLFLAPAPPVPPSATTPAIFHASSHDRVQVYPASGRLNLGVSSQGYTSHGSWTVALTGRRPSWCSNHTLAL